MEIDWENLEEVLYSLVKDELTIFTSKNSDERFCALCLDCNAHHGDVFLCLNTSEDRNERALYYKNSYPNSYGTIEKALDMLLFSPADWKYYEINSRIWDKWKEFKSKIEDAWLEEDDNDREDVFKQFLEVVCRVTIRIEGDNVLDRERRTDDFTVMCTDHDEPEEDSLERLEGVRKKMNKG